MGRRGRGERGDRRSGVAENEEEEDDYHECDGKASCDDNKCDDENGVTLEVVTMEKKVKEGKGFGKKKEWIPVQRGGQGGEGSLWESCRLLKAKQGSSVSSRWALLLPHQPFPSPPTR